MQKEIKDLLRSTGLFLLGKEPNKIPLSGLTLSKVELQTARTWLSKQGDHGNNPKYVKEFERKFKDHSGLHSFTFGSGRSALTAIIRALDINKGDAVLLPAFTCIAVPNAFWFEGVEVEFYDIELDTYGPSLADIKIRFSSNPKIKAIVIQHSFGLIGNEFESVIEFAQSQDLLIVEDCAHTMDSKLGDKLVGQFGHATFYSMERSKVISTFFGGIACTNDPEIASRLAVHQEKAENPSIVLTRKILENFIFTYQTQRHKDRWIKKLPQYLFFKSSYLTSNSGEELRSVKPVNYFRKLSEAQAAIGISQLDKMAWARKVRQQVAQEWKFWTNARELQGPRVKNRADNVMLRYPVLVSPEQKNDLSWLDHLGAEIGVWYKSQLHPIEKVIDGCPNALFASQRCINLPINFVDID